MKKIYEAPELEIFKVEFDVDMLLTNSQEQTIGEVIDPGDNEDPITIDF